MKKVIGIVIFAVGLLLMAFAVIQGIMIDQELYQYVFCNTDQLGLLLSLGLGLCFTSLKAEMI